MANDGENKTPDVDDTDEVVAEKQALEARGKAVGIDVDRRQSVADIQKEVEAAEADAEPTPAPDDSGSGDLAAQVAALTAQLNQERAEVKNDQVALKSALADVDKMKKDLKKAAGMDEPAPQEIAHQLNPGHDYEPPTFAEICKLVGKSMTNTMRGFAKYKKMNKEEMEEWGCRSWNHIMHMQAYYEDRAITKYKTWIRNLNNAVKLSLDTDDDDE